MKVINLLFLIFVNFISLPVYSSEQSFEDWKKDFRKHALKNNISKETIDITTVSYTHLTLPTTPYV